MRLRSEDLCLNSKSSTEQWGLIKEGLTLCVTQFPPWVIALPVLSHRITLGVDYKTVQKPHLTLKFKCYYYSISIITVMGFQ